MGIIRHLICDLDGVVWSGPDLISGSVDALCALQAEGVSVWFVTNNSNQPPSHYLDRLAAAGLDHQGQIITSAQAAATLLEQGQKVLICAGRGVHQAVEEAGAVPVANVGKCLAEDVDAVVVGLHEDFDYGRLDRASRAVRAGAQLIGTNSDTTFPTSQGEAPGGGAILAAVEAASGQRAVLAGKPNVPMVEALLRRVGSTFDATSTVMVGDRYTTDGRFAEQLGCRFLAVSSGVAPDAVGVPVWERVSSLGVAVPLLLGAT